MNKTISSDHYLKAIYQLQQQQPVVRRVDIAQAMAFSKPSVTRAITLLKKMGYVTVEKHQIRLTSKGKKEAENLWQRFKSIYDYLTAAGISNDAATKDACLLEHSLSEETYHKLLNKITF